MSRKRITGEENVLLQLKNIETYPFVAEALKSGNVHLHGWYYDIGSGSMCSYNPSADGFERIGS